MLPYSFEMFIRDAWLPVGTASGSMLIIDAVRVSGNKRS